MEQELPTLPEYLSSLPVFSAVRVTQSLVLYVCFVDPCLSFWPLCCIATCKQNVGQKEDFMHSNFHMDISLPWIDAAFT
jgi:hypothetical protein